MAQLLKRPASIRIGNVIYEWLLKSDASCSGTHLNGLELSVCVSNLYSARIIFGLYSIHRTVTFLPHILTLGERVGDTIVPEPTALK